MANQIAYGFITLQDFFNQRVAGVGPARVFEAVRLSSQTYTQELNDILSFMVRRTTTAQESFELPGSGTLQPMTESGAPYPVKQAARYQVAYPIQGGADAWAATRVALAHMTVEEANVLTLNSMRRDADWMLRHVLAALLDNTSWTFTDLVGAGGTKGLGDITIQPLANADTVQYLNRLGNAGTDNHYHAQTAGIADATNPFPAIRTELIEHPANQGATLIAMVATDLIEDIQALSSFIEQAPRVIRVGANQDALVGTPPPAGPADRFIGYIQGADIWVYEYGRLPDGYIVTVADGSTGGPPVAQREFVPTELQGFFPEPWTPDAGVSQTNMIRYAGFGVRNRVAAVVTQIGAAVANVYEVPEGFETPLPV